MNNRKYGVRLAALLGTIMLLGACEGSNLFEQAGAGSGGGGGSTGPTIDLTAAATAMRGDTVWINVLAQSAAGLEEVQISARGAISGDTIDAASGSVYAATWFFQTPVGGDTVLVVRGRAVDVQGRISSPDSVRVRLF